MEDQKEEITIVIDKSLVTALRKDADESYDSLSFLIQNVLYAFPMYKDFALLGRLANITGIRIPILEKYYEQSRKAIEFWRASLPTKPKADVLQDQEGHYFAKFPKHKDYIPLPETGHLIRILRKELKT